MNCSPTLDDLFVEEIYRAATNTACVTAAQIAKQYGAPPEAVTAILLLQIKRAGEMTQ